MKTKKKKSKEQVQEFIDIDHKVMGEYYETLEEGLSSKQFLKKMYQFIGEDKDFYDPYLDVSRILFMEGKLQEGAQFLKEAYDRALEKITDVHGNWPQSMRWGFLENRHIMRAIDSYAYFCWNTGRIDQALDIFRRLFRANPNDNQGVRHSILGLRLGLGPHEWQKPFETEINGEVIGLDACKLTEWFEKNSKQFPEEFQFFFDFDEQ